MNNLYSISQKDIEEAHQRISSYVHRTPILTSTELNRIAGCSIYFKCENFQKIGAFKMRGASNAILQLSSAKKANGVVTHSSGNHAQAVAKAAQKTNTKAYIVMPNTAPKVKIKAVENYGGIITFCEPTLAARENMVEEVMKQTGATFIHPFDNKAVITGQATAAKELLEETTDLDAILCPVGGGGLLAGTILAANYFKKNTKVFAGEPVGADDAYQSIRAGKLIPLTHPNTIADGLLTSLGQLNFKIINKGIEEIYTVSDEEIIAAMRLIWERMKIIIEPSCAVPFAALLKNKSVFNNKRVGIILSGGNVDLDKFFQELTN